MMISTTHRGILTVMHPINRRYRVYHLDLHTAILAGKYYSDWILAGTKSLSQNAGDFLFSDGTFAEVYLSEFKQKVTENMSLNDFCNNVGVSEKIKSDRAPELCRRNSEFLKYAKQKEIYLTYAEPERKNQIAPIGVDIR